LRLAKASSVIGLLVLTLPIDDDLANGLVANRGFFVQLFATIGGSAQMHVAELPGIFDSLDKYRQALLIDMNLDCGTVPGLNDLKAEH
jgi:hypothetical protein